MNKNRECFLCRKILTRRRQIKFCSVTCAIINMRAIKNKTPKDRFFLKIDKTNYCWNWKGTISNFGYGLISVNGIYKLAHRFSYELFLKKIPARLTIDHLCRNRRCVNPEHLEAVSQKENTLRGVGPAAINSKKTHCLNGHPFSGENLAIYRDKSRRCRICARRSSYKHYLKIKNNTN